MKQDTRQGLESQWAYHKLRHIYGESTNGWTKFTITWNANLQQRLEESCHIVLLFCFSWQCSDRNEHPEFGNNVANHTPSCNSNKILIWSEIKLSYRSTRTFLELARSPFKAYSILPSKNQTQIYLFELTRQIITTSKWFNTSIILRILWDPHSTY